MWCFGVRSRAGWGLIVVVSLLGLSCSGSGSLNAVRGKVVYKSQPLAGALVTFHPKEKADLKTVPSTGLTKEDGTFTLSTGDKDGAPAGEYVITIVRSESVGGKPGVISTGPVETQDTLRGAYANREASKIFATIKQGENQLEPFDLK